MGNESLPFEFLATESRRRHVAGLGKSTATTCAPRRSSVSNGPIAAPAPSTTNTNSPTPSSSPLSSSSPSPLSLPLSLLLLLLAVALPPPFLWVYAFFFIIISAFFFFNTHGRKSTWPPCRARKPSTADTTSGSITPRAAHERSFSKHSSPSSSCKSLPMGKRTSSSPPPRMICSAAAPEESCLSRPSTQPVANARREPESGRAETASRKLTSPQRNVS
mmetsp:Transcript_33326/g.66355  ORF Transcript_33326/g.66355 Transcript_33326/m.66355 type:complete len:219 (+) Transcript_33326:512-1168(+)